jgi:proteasome lid subunit RPN8/RPN11
MKRKVIILKECIEKIEALTFSSRNMETGGLMFGRMNPNWVKIFDVCGPGENAQSSKYSISMDMDFLADYTMEKTKQDLYILGTWHTHPKDSSLIASNIDIETMINFNENYNLFYDPIFAICGLIKGDIKYQLYEVIRGEVKQIKQSEGEFVIE